MRSEELERERYEQEKKKEKERRNESELEPVWTRCFHNSILSFHNS